MRIEVWAKIIAGNSMNFLKMPERGSLNRAAARAITIACLGRENIQWKNFLSRVSQS